MEAKTRLKMETMEIISGIMVISGGLGDEMGWLEHCREELEEELELDNGALEYALIILLYNSLVSTSELLCLF